MIMTRQLADGRIALCYIGHGKALTEWCDEDGKNVGGARCKFFYDGYWFHTFDDNGVMAVGNATSDEELIALHKYVEKNLQPEPEAEIMIGNDEHIEKLIKERDDLAKKISRLKKFMKSDKFNSLDGPYQEMLSLQKTQMKALLKTLDMRIDWENC